MNNEIKKEVEKIEAIFPNTYQVCIRIFGIPVYSKTRTIDEDALYKRMADRFLEELRNLNPKG